MEKKLLARTRRARKNLARKLKLERTFNRELTTLFNTIAKQFKSFYSVSGQILPRPLYVDEISALLRKHYKRTSKEFKNEMREKFSPKHFNNMETKQDEEETDALVDTAIALYTLQQVPIRSNLITNTTERNMLDVEANAITKLRDEGLPVTNLAIASIGATELNKIFNGRITTIAITETQNMAEATKAIESAITLSDEVIDPLQAVSLIINARKEWASVLIETTRNGHASADGQTVLFNAPYIVSGEQLRWPGDTSLGASIGNIANCLCSSLISPF